MILKEPTNALLPLHLAVPSSNKMIQARASSSVKDIHTAVNSIMIRHVNPVLNMRGNSVTTPGYGGLNSKTNPIFDPMVTMATKMVSLDLDPGTFIAPGTVCASSNPSFYPLSEFGHPANAPNFDLTRPGYYGIPNASEQAASIGHDSPRFGGKLTPFYNPGT